jgi:hypothetical protein
VHIFAYKLFLIFLAFDILPGLKAEFINIVKNIFYEPRYHLRYPSRPERRGLSRAWSIILAYIA